MGVENEFTRDFGHDQFDLCPGRLMVYIQQIVEESSFSL